MSKSEIERLIDEVHAAQDKDEDALKKINPDLALQKHLQNQAANTQMMSNMMNMMHETSMSIIRNIRA